PPSRTVAGFIATALGLLWGLVYRRVYDRIVRKRIRRFLAEHLDGPGPFRCDIELRPQGVWTRQNNVEVVLHWSDATGVTDGEDAVEIDFRNGIVIARNRGFLTGL